MTRFSKTLDSDRKSEYTSTMTQNSENLTSLDCLDAYGDALDCAGEVEYRLAMSPTGRSFPRCEKHFEERWEEQERISRTYGVPLTYYGNDVDGWNDDYSDY